MFKNLKLLKGRVLSFFLLTSVLVSMPVLAVDADDKPQPYDVRIIVDISGSMKNTDPSNLRIPALNLLLELMPEGAQAGIWTFGRYVNNLLPVSPVNDQWRQQAKQAALAINSVGLKTNLTGALNDAAWGLKADSGFQQSIILLTDGQIDMADEKAPNAEQVNLQERQRLMTQVLDKYRKAGANIHTLALSDLADKTLLQEIALETDGLYSEAQNAEALMASFLRAFDRAVPAEQVPMEDNTFVIDSSVDEFTALIFKRSQGSKDSALLTPSGDRFSALEHPKNVRWHSDVHFDLITIKKPEAGTWIAEADLDPSNRVTILSDLALSVEGIPTTIFPGDKLDVTIMLTNEGKVVDKAEILRLTDVTMTVGTASGREGSKLLSDPENPPEDGIYHEGLYRLKEMGQYKVDVIMEGKTFQRKRSLSMTMMQPIEIIHQADVEQNIYRIEVKPLSDNLDLERTRVIAKIKSPDDSTIIQSVTYDADTQSWVSIVSAAKGPGEYSVDLNVRGITQSGKNFKVKPDTIVFNLPVEAEVAQDKGIAPNLAMEDMTATQEETAAEVNDPAVQAPELEVPKLEPETIAVPQAEVVEKPQVQPSPEETTLESSEGLAWWIYLIIALVNIGVIGAGVWWFLLRKPSAVDAQTDREKKEVVADIEDLEDEFAGDFDSLDEGDEEEIPLKEDVAKVELDVETAESDASMDPSTGSVDVDSIPEVDAFDEDFSIDPDDTLDIDEDSWGEFDDKKD